MPDEKNPSQQPAPPAQKLNPNAPEVAAKRSAAAKALVSKIEAEAAKEGAAIVDMTPVIIDSHTGRGTIVAVLDHGAAAAPHSRLFGIGKRDQDDLAKHEGPDSKARPHAWAHAERLLRSDSYVRHVPWQFRAAALHQKWPDPSSDPEFTITKAEFDEAIAEVDPEYKPSLKVDAPKADGDKGPPSGDPPPA